MIISQTVSKRKIYMIVLNKTVFKNKIELLCIHKKKKKKKKKNI